MSLMQRAATFAVMTLSLAGLIGISSPGLALGIDRSAVPTPIFESAVLNTQSDLPVPQPAPTVAAQDATKTAAADDDDAQGYDTLAEAVAAQDASDASDALRCVAGAIYFEAKGEPLAGQLAVAQVIINRSKSGRFPADVCSVVKQRGQFGFVRGGEIPSIDQGRTAYRTAIAVAKVALAAAWNSPAAKALYFNTPNRVPGARLTRIASIGNHVFYR